jgi:hypothetical protein
MPEFTPEPKDCKLDKPSAGEDVKRTVMADITPQPLIPREGAPPFYLRAAYGTFSVFSLEIFLSMLLSRRRLQELPLGRVSLLTLSWIFCLARSHPVSTFWGRRLVVIFLFHNFFSLLIGVYQTIVQRTGDAEGWDGETIFATRWVLYLVWVICAIIAIRTQTAYPSFVLMKWQRSETV